MKMFTIALLALSLLASCDRVGSEAWCENLSEKPKGEWTIEETKQYAKYCVLGLDPERLCEKLEEKPKGEWTASEAADYAKNCIVGRDEE